MSHSHRSVIVALMLCLPLAACGEDESSEPAQEVAAATPPVEQAEPETPAEEAPAEEAPAEVPAAPPAEGDTTPLLSLREGFAADSGAWAGRHVTVGAQFMSATSVGGRLNNISLIVSREDYAEDRLAHSMMCAFGDDAPASVDLVQYQEVTVRGTVVERFGRAGLDDCEIVTDSP